MTFPQPNDSQGQKNVVFQTKSGTRHSQYKLYLLKPYFVLDRRDSATIIPISPSGRLLLQTQYLVHTGRESWEFPMGSIDPGESPEQALKRELKEETGLTCNAMEQVGCYCPIPGLSTQQTYVFVAHVTDERLGQTQVALEEGISAFQIVDVPGFRALTGSAEIIDGFTLEHSRSPEALGGDSGREGSKAMKCLQR